MKRIGRVFSISGACVFLVIGCGGGGGSNSGDPDVLTGIFVDSAVEGVSYSTETQSDMTNSVGEFSYLQGENVTFSIGSLVFPTVPAAAEVSPVDLAASSSDPSATSTNIARLLQSLDLDGNPENGISISAEAAIGAPQLNFDVSVSEFENNAEVINLVANSGSVTMALISAEDANAHLNSTLGTTAQTNNDGLWLRNAASDTDSGVANYSFIDGLSVTRYDGGIASDGSECHTAAKKSNVSLGDNRYQLNADSGPVLYEAVRVGETLEVTFDGEATLVYPRATGIDHTALPLCEDSGSNGGGGSNFSVSGLVAGSPWYSVFEKSENECGNKYTYTTSGEITIIFQEFGSTEFQTATGSFTISDTGFVVSQFDNFGDQSFQLNSLTNTEWSAELVNNSGESYIDRAFSSREAAIQRATSLGINCENNLPQ